MEPYLIKGSLDGRSGYGVLTIAIVRALLRAGFPVRTEVVGVQGEEVPPEVQSTVGGGEAIGRELLVEPPTTPPTPGRDSYRFTMSETLRVPEGEMRGLRESKAILTPNETNLGTYVGQGAECPVMVVPLGLDPRDYEFFPPRLGGTLVFGAAGRVYDGGGRKNFGAVVGEFLEAFPVECDVMLFVKCTEECPVELVTDPRIRFFRKTLPAEELYQWYRAIDVFVSASRGEGWGLMQHQAMMCGRPVISISALGTRDLITEDSSFIVDHRWKEHPVAGRGLWPDPVPGGIMRKMRLIRENRSVLGKKAEISRARGALFSEDRFGDRLLTALKEVGYLV